MGTHPIFESDFDCLTDCKSKMDCSTVEAAFSAYSSVCDNLESSGMKPAFDAAVSAQRDVIKNAGLDCHFTVCGVSFGDDHDHGKGNASMITMSILFIFAMMIFQKLLR